MSATAPVADRWFESISLQQRVSSKPQWPNADAAMLVDQRFESRCDAAPITISLRSPGHLACFRLKSCNFTLSRPSQATSATPQTYTAESPEIPPPAWTLTLGTPEFLD